MIKKTALTAFFLLVWLTSQAEIKIGSSIKRVSSIHTIRNGMTSGGFYVNAGLSIASNTYFGEEDFLRKPQHTFDYSASGSDKYISIPYNFTARGLQGSIEIGNHWVFHRSKNNFFSIGMNVSWITLGLGGFNSDQLPATMNNISVTPLRLGPVSTFAFKEKFAIDAFFNVAPTANVAFVQNTDDYYTFMGGGIVMVPGLRFRYRKLAIGVETQHGKLTSDIFEDSELLEAKMFHTRFTLGFRF